MFYLFGSCVERSTDRNQGHPMRSGSCLGCRPLWGWPVDRGFSGSSCRSRIRTETLVSAISSLARLALEVIANRILDIEQARTKHPPAHPQIVRDRWFWNIQVAGGPDGGEPAEDPEGRPQSLFWV